MLNKYLLIILFLGIILLTSCTTVNDSIKKIQDKCYTTDELRELEYNGEDYQTCHIHFREGLDSTDKGLNFNFLGINDDDECKRNVEDDCKKYDTCVWTTHVNGQRASGSECWKPRWQGICTCFPNVNITNEFKDRFVYHNYSIPTNYPIECMTEEEAKNILGENNVK